MLTLLLASSCHTYSPPIDVFCDAYNPPPKYGQAAFNRAIAREAKEQGDDLRDLIAYRDWTTNFLLRGFCECDWQAQKEANRKEICEAWEK